MVHVISLYNPHQAAVTNALLAGNHSGPNGSIALAKKHILPLAKSGDVKMMMLLANVHYTAAGAFGIKALPYKLLAAYHLLQAKKWATTAFKSAGRHASLLIALSCVEVQLSDGGVSKLSHGDVHILMSCYIQWYQQVIIRLKITNTADNDVKIIMRCHEIIDSSQDHTELKVLSASTLVAFPGTAEKQRSKLKDSLYRFTCEHYFVLICQPPEEARRSLAQTLCRVCRSIGHHEAAALLAKHYDLGDQLTKAAAKS